jgi:hypothetical protein
MQENYLHKLTIFSRYFVTLFVSFSRAQKIQLPIKHYHLSRRCFFLFNLHCPMDNDSANLHRVFHFYLVHARKFINTTDSLELKTATEKSTNSRIVLRSNKRMRRKRKERKTSFVVTMRRASRRREKLQNSTLLWMRREKSYQHCESDSIG